MKFVQAKTGNPGVRTGIITPARRLESLDRRGGIFGRREHYDVWLLCFASCTGFTGQNENGTVSLNVSPVPASPTGGIGIEYILPQSAHVTITIHDLSGRVVDEIQNDFFAAGQYSLHWYPEESVSGVYFITLKAGISETTTGFVIID